MMNYGNQNYLVIGQGAIGSQVSHKLVEMGVQVSGMARGHKTDYQLDENVTFIQADASQVAASKLKGFKRIAIIISPKDYTESGYRSSYLAVAQHFANLKNQLPNLERLVFISSTGVYGQNSGEWVDEQTPPKKPARIGSQIILQSEQVLRHSFGNTCVVIRPSGIYGIRRLMRVNQAKQVNKKPMAAKAWTNRIMDTDLANIISQVLLIDQPKGLYIATDFQPVTAYQLTLWLANKLDATPPSIDKNLPATGKRLKANIPQDWVEFKDWQHGYQHILNNLS